MSQEKKRKRINIVVDVETYDKFKRLLEAMGITITDFFDDSMNEFIKSMETIVENEDKEAFLQMIAKNLDSLQNRVSEELKK